MTCRPTAAENHSPNFRSEMTRRGGGILATSFLSDSSQDSICSGGVSPKSSVTDDALEAHSSVQDFQRPSCSSDVSTGKPWEFRPTQRRQNQSRSSSRSSGRHPVASSVEATNAHAPSSLAKAHSVMTSGAAGSSTEVYFIGTPPGSGRKARSVQPENHIETQDFEQALHKAAKSVEHSSGMPSAWHESVSAPSSGERVERMCVASAAHAAPTGYGGDWPRSPRDFLRPRPEPSRSGTEDVDARGSEGVSAPKTRSSSTRIRRDHKSVSTVDLRVAAAQFGFTVRGTAGQSDRSEEWLRAGGCQAVRGSSHEVKGASISGRSVGVNQLQPQPPSVHPSSAAIGKNGTSFAASDHVKRQSSAPSTFQKHPSQMSTSRLRPSSTKSSPSSAACASHERCTADEARSIGSDSKLHPDDVATEKSVRPQSGACGGGATSSMPGRASAWGYPSSRLQSRGKPPPPTPQRLRPGVQRRPSSSSSGGSVCKGCSPAGVQSSTNVSRNSTSALRTSLTQRCPSLTKRLGLT